MGTNSIRSNISKATIISDINLCINAGISKNNAILVLEGWDDIRFFRGKVHNTVELYESFSGKTGVVEIVQHFSSKRVLGVCDRDYVNDNVNEKIFYYDYNNLEIMLTSSDSVFSSLADVHYFGDLHYAQLRLLLLKDLKFLSIIRKLNAENSWGLTLRGISLFQAFEIKSKRLLCDNIKDQIKKSNPSPISKIEDKIALVNEIYSDENYEIDYYQITQGHDFLSYLQCHCSLCSGKKIKRPSSETLFVCLLSAFNANIFRQTKLYIQMLGYQEKNSIAELFS